MHRTRAEEICRFRTMSMPYPVHALRRNNHWQSPHFVTQRMQIFHAAVYLFLQVKYLWCRQTQQAACGKRSAEYSRQKRQRNGASANIFLFYVGFTSRLHSIIVASSPSSFAGISLASARNRFLTQEGSILNVRVGTNPIPFFCIKKVEHTKEIQ